MAKVEGSVERGIMKGPPLMKKGSKRRSGLRFKFLEATSILYELQSWQLSLDYLRLSQALVICFSLLFVL